MPYKFENIEVFGLGERGSGFKARSLDGFQNFVKIKEKCLREKLIFEDDEFPASNSSIGSTDEGTVLPNYIWKRSTEICAPLKPEFIVGGADRFDVRQGELGNCWLLAAISDITLNKELFRVLVPEDNAFGDEYCGAFHFRFWQFGKWIDVVVDDRLPCREDDGELAFLTPIAKNEFWSPLLEKAYAKLNGTYSKLDGGFTLEALADFTGGFTEVIELDKLKDIDISGPEELFDILFRSFERSSFMGVNVKGNPDVVEEEMENGLIRGHAYSITDIKVITINRKGKPARVRLFRMRNPWGSEAEWKGAWSDNSVQWTFCSEEQKKELQVSFAADGEFWMSYKDFLLNIERIELCHMMPFTEEGVIAERKGIAAKQWISHLTQGQWTRGVTAGGSYKHRDTTFANNPQFLLKVGEKEGDDNTVVICLLKKDRKLEPENCEVSSMSFHIFKIEEDSPKPLDASFFKNPKNKQIEQPMRPIKTLREITVRMILPFGTYCLICASVKPDQEGDFLLRVFTEGDSIFYPYDEQIHVEEKEVGVKDDTKEDKEKIENAQKFFKVVAGDKEEVSWWDLKLVLDKCFHDEFQYEGFGFSEDVCRSMVALNDTDKTGKLGFYEFTGLWSQVVAWRKLFNEHDGGEGSTLGTLDTHELKSALKAGGYTVNKEVLENVVLRYGDKNGQVALDKFIIAALKVSTMMELFKRHDSGNQKATISLSEWMTQTIYC